MVLFFHALKNYGLDFSDINFYLFFFFLLFIEFFPVKLQSFVKKNFDEESPNIDLYLSTGMIVSVLSAVILNVSDAMLIPLFVFLVLKSKLLFSKNFYYFLFNVSGLGILIFISFNLFQVFINFFGDSIVISSIVVALISIIYFVLNLLLVLLFLFLLYGSISKSIIFKIVGEGRLTNIFSTAVNTFIVYLLYSYIGISAIPISLFTILAIHLGNYYATKYRKAKLDLLMALAKSLEEKDKYTYGHGENVAKISTRIAKRLGYSGKELSLLEIAGLLHDIGKIGIPDYIISKTGKLTPEEYEIMKEHSKKGYEILKQITEYQNTVAKWILHHHERWDGKGYPEGLVGEEIPIESRILTISDVYDALTSDRPYRKAWSKEKALSFIKENSGIIFDPKVVKVFLELVEDGVL